MGKIIELTSVPPIAALLLWKVMSLVIANDEGRRTTPSVVAFKNGERKVEICKTSAITNPVNTIMSVKRFIMSL